jgi:hypothetical protein
MLLASVDDRTRLNMPIWFMNKKVSISFCLCCAVLCCAVLCCAIAMLELCSPMVIIRIVY